MIAPLIIRHAGTSHFVLHVRMYVSQTIIINSCFNCKPNVFETRTLIGVRLCEYCIINKMIFVALIIPKTRI